MIPFMPVRFCFPGIRSLIYWLVYLFVKRITQTFRGSFDEIFSRARKWLLMNDQLDFCGDLDHHLDPGFLRDRDNLRLQALIWSMLTPSEINTNIRLWQIFASLLKCGGGLFSLGRSLLPSHPSNLTQVRLLLWWEKQKTKKRKTSCFLWLWGGDFTKLMKKLG